MIYPQNPILIMKVPIVVKAPNAQLLQALRDRPLRRRRGLAAVVEDLVANARARTRARACGTLCRILEFPGPYPEPRAA